MHADTGEPVIVFMPDRDSSNVGAPRRHSASGIRGTILHLWFARKAALDEGDLVEAQARVEELKAYMRQEGITADRSISRGFAYEGYENLREGNYERAREAFDQARTFDPYLPQAQFGYAWSLLRAGRGFFTFVNEYLKGAQLSWGQLTTDEILISNLGIVLALAIFTTLTIVSLFVIARCQGRVRHDIFESARRVLPEGGARVLSWAIFFLPILFWVGGLWLILFWLVLCFRHMRIVEKAVACCVFILIGIAPLSIQLVVDRFESSTDPETRVIVAAMQEGYNPTTLQRLQQVAVEHPESPEIQLLLGSLYARGDLQGEAYDSFRRVLEMRPSNTSALINVGNVYYRLGEYAQAVSRYKQALQIQPDLVSAYWNLYQAQTELLHFAEAEDSLARARDLDSEEVGRMLAGKKDAGAGQLIYESADLGRIRDELRGSAFDGVMALGVLENPMSLGSVVSLAICLILVVVAGRPTSESCTRCGRAFCASCRPDASDQGYCRRCMHLLLKREQVKAQVRVEELARLKRGDAIRKGVRRVLSLLLPGSGQILAGRAAFGLPVLTGWVVMGLWVLTHEKLLLGPRVPVSDMPPVGLILGIAGMAILWILANVASISRRYRLGEEHGA